MKGNVMSESELAFARIVWENAPLPSGELVTRCKEELGWEKADHLHRFEEPLSGRYL